LRDCQGFEYATAADQPITDSAAICLTLPVFEMTGVFASAVDKWGHNKPITDQTLANFKTNFNFENKERLRSKLTAQTAGFHGPNQAAVIPSSPTPAPAVEFAATPGQHNPPAPPAVAINNIKIYYCWTHGLGKQSATHTSTTCANPGEGHKHDATILNMMGGNNRIYINCPRQLRLHP
jgi:hypothetical protein